MRKLILSLLLTVVLLMLSIAGITAAPVDNGALEMAKYFPQETVLFFTMRTGEATIDDVDRIISTTLGGAPLPPDVPLITLRQALEMSLQQANLELSDIYAWLGDRLAFGLTDVHLDGSGTSGYVVLEITDRAALENFITTQTANLEVDSRVEGAYTVYSGPNGSSEGQLLVGDTLALFLSPGMSVPEFPLAISLLNNPAYQVAAEALPASTYDIAAYVDPRAFILEADLDQVGRLGLNENAVNPVMVGFTLLDNYSLVMDIAQVPGADGGNAAVSRLDPGFLKFIPADASTVALGTDLTGSFEQLNDTLTQLSRTNDTPNPIIQFENVLQSLGFDLQNDILSWTTGDYALFLRTDIRPIVQGVLNNQVNIAGNFDLGLVIEATNAETAKTFAAKLGTLISTLLRDQDGLTVAQDTLEGAAVTSITLTVPVSSTENLSLTLVIGASDDVFFIGTQDAIVEILRGEGGLDTGTAYQQASKYILPNPISILYTDGEGLVIGVAGMTIGSLTLLGPSIGQVFDNITSELQNSPSTYNPLDVQPVYVQNEDPTQQLLALLDYAIRVIGSTSISSTVTPDGASVIRFVITLNPQ